MDIQADILLEQLIKYYSDEIAAMNGLEQHGKPYACQVMRARANQLQQVIGSLQGMKDQVDECITNTRCN